MKTGGKVGTEKEPQECINEVDNNTGYENSGDRLICVITEEGKYCDKYEIKSDGDGTDRGRGSLCN